MDKKEETLGILGSTIEMINWCMGSREEDRFLKKLIIGERDVGMIN